MPKPQGVEQLNTARKYALIEMDNKYDHLPQAKLSTAIMISSFPSIKNYYKSPLVSRRVKKIDSVWVADKIL